MTSDGHERLEPRLLRAAAADDVDGLRSVIALAHDYGQFNDNFLRIGLMRSAERGCVAATEFLLGLGAKTDVASNRLSPLLRAVERDHYPIVRLLLDYGASPDTADKEGRTALMTAAWRNNADILQLLIMRGANVNARDLRRRNALHNLAADKACRWGWGDEVVALLLRTDCRIDGPDGRDELGRTPLHWACATGNRRLAELLLTRPDGPKAEIDATESRGKTALHVATAHDRVDIILLLLQHDAAVNACSDGGWTPLHNACDKGCEGIVRILLRAGAHINSQLLNGVTALHLAAQGGHREVVECLLERPDLKRRVRDNFGSTPFLRAAQFKRKDIVSLLAPFNNVESLSDDVKDACAAFDATVVDFGNFHNENRVKRMSVFNLLYGRDSENPRKQAVTTLPADSRATDFRWIHLPANNMAWVEALLNKSFIEEGAHDVDGFKGLEKSFNYQHRGQKIHSHFMRPLCQNTPRTLKRRDEEKSEDHSDTAQPHVADNSSMHHKHKSLGGKLDRTDSHSHDENSSGKKSKKEQKRGKSGSNPGTPKNESKSKFPWGHNDKARSSPLSSSTLCRDPHGLVSACNVCVFMPYLHFETAERRQKMQDAIQRAETLSFQPRGMQRSRTRDEVLIDAHLSSSTTSLHVRRTLDQFFYPNIDTQSRDQDQVVYRYQTKGPGRESPGTDPKIFMVDQLWMWVLGTNLIVTSFPQRWDQPKNDPLNVLDGIIEDINSKTRDPVKSVYDLAIIITNRCSGVFDRHRLGDDEYQFLDMFESSIGIATDRETLLFNRFNQASMQASSWLKSHRKLNRFARSSARSVAGRDGAPEDIVLDEEEDFDDEPHFVDRLLDIGEETGLLAEAKDIRDELNMIRTVLEHQKHVLADFQEVICEIYQGQHRSQYEVKKRFKDQQRTIDMHIKDIDRMDKQAERIYHSITDLLDLKQKHANAFEARFARDQAAGTTRQSRTIMVFTIVTIVFLPLSFITSIFTINMREFDNLTLAYVSKYTFGVGFAISIPMILVALSLDDIGDFFRMGTIQGRRWWSRRGESALPPARPDAQLQALEIEKILSMARSRRSADLDYGPSLLPVSTRGTAASRQQALHANALVNGSARKSLDVRHSVEYRPRS